MTPLRTRREERLCEEAHYEAIRRLKVAATSLRVRDKDDEGARLIVQMMEEARSRLKG